MTDRELERLADLIVERLAPRLADLLRADQRTHEAPEPAAAADASDEDLNRWAAEVLARVRAKPPRSPRPRRGR